VLASKGTRVTRGSSAPLTVRRFEPEDAAVCCEIINTAIVTMDGLNAPARALVVSKNVPEQLRGELMRGFALVAVGPDGPEAVGMLDGGEIARLYVDPKCQRHGAGALLVRALEVEARRRGLGSVELHASPSSVSTSRSGFERSLRRRAATGTPSSSTSGCRKTSADAPTRGQRLIAGFCQLRRLMVA